jgi:hypothetical protein
MTDSDKAKLEADGLGAKDEKAKEVRLTTAQVEQEDLGELDSVVKEHDEERHTTERNEKQDLNQGMDTGTHDAGRTGIEWGDAYKVRSTTSHKILRGDTPDETPKK